MRQYETMVLVSPSLGDEAVEKRIAHFEKQVAEGGGEILKVDRWGKKRLAYPIERQRHGIYYVITYKAEPSTVREIEREMHLNEDTWRHMTVRMDAALLRKLEKNAKRAAAQQEGGGGSERGRRSESGSGSEGSSGN